VPAQTAQKAAEVDVGPAATGTAGPDTAGGFRSHTAVFREGSGVDSARAGAAQLSSQFPHSASLFTAPLLLAPHRSPPDGTPAKDSASSMVRLDVKHVNFGERESGE